MVRLGIRFMGGADARMIGVFTTLTFEFEKRMFGP